MERKEKVADELARLRAENELLHRRVRAFESFTEAFVRLVGLQVYTHKL